MALPFSARAPVVAAGYALIAGLFCFHGDADEVTSLLAACGVAAGLGFVYAWLYRRIPGTLMTRRYLSMVISLTLMALLTFAFRPKASIDPGDLGLYMVVVIVGGAAGWLPGLKPNAA